MRRRPGVREWLATALSVVCASSLLVMEQQERSHATLEPGLVRLRAERDALAEYTDERVAELRERLARRPPLSVPPARWFPVAAEDGFSVYESVRTARCGELLRDVEGWSDDAALRSVAISEQGRRWRVVFARPVGS